MDTDETEGNAIEPFLHGCGNEVAPIAARLIRTIHELVPSASSRCYRGAIHFDVEGRPLGYVWPLRGCVELNLVGVAGELEPIRIREPGFSLDPVLRERLRALAAR